MATGIPTSIQTAPLLKQWVQSLADGRFQIYSGKVELGQGISAALVKVACEELCIHPGQVDLLAGHTAYSPDEGYTCLLYTSPSPRDRTRYRMPSSA